MNRRESRVSTGTRQNDALFEFESFKKKFLLANKHITKLNSTLSVRIEELNAQISTLYVENLRLRASEIALTAELKKEREKSRKIIAEAETATASLSQHLVFLRNTLNIRPASPPPSPTPPKARRPVISSVVSPQLPRLSRPPSFPGIFEEDEGSSPNEDLKDEQSDPKTASPFRTKTKDRTRLSASRLPLPARGSPPLYQTLPPPPVPSLTMEVALSGGGVTVKKLSRRRGGLLPANVGGSHPQRPPSPAFGSPIAKDIALEEDDEAPDEKGTVYADRKADDQTEGEAPEKPVKRDKRKGKQKDREPEKNEELFIDAPRPREREQKKGGDEDTCSSTTVPDSKLKLKDVTNSPRSRSVLPPNDTGIADHGRHQNADSDIHGLIAGGTQVYVSVPMTSSSPAQLPTPRASSSPVPVPPPESEATVTQGRERRARKSVNYAEPKLNTKMRKPDTLSGSTSTNRKRSVALFANVPLSEEDVDEPAPRSSLENDVTPKPTKPLPSLSSSSSTAFPPPPPLPRTLPAANPPAPTSRPSAATTVKRKKGRSYAISSDDESDGVQGDVDADFDDMKRLWNGWLNVERRRRSAHVQGVSRAVIGAGTGGEMNVNGQAMVESKEGRRHSVAV